MGDYALFRWLTTMFPKGACIVSVPSLIACALVTIVVWFAIDAIATSRDERALQRELFSRQLSELERQAEHKRLLEIIETLKDHRDLSLPADPDEGF